MKRARFALGPWIVFLFILPNAEAFQWKDDVDAALKEAKEKSQMALIYFYHPASLADDKKVWLNPLVQQYSEKFMAIQVNIDSRGEIAARYSIQAFPTVAFFDPNGDEIIALRFEGEKLKRTLLAARMSRVEKAVEAFALVESQIKRNTDAPQWILLYAKGLRDRGRFAEAEEQFKRLFGRKDLDDKLLTEAKSSFINMLFLQASRYFFAGDYARCIETLERYRREYPGEEGMNQANLLTGIALCESGEKTRGEKILKELARNAAAGIFKEKARQYLEEKKGR